MGLRELLDKILGRENTGREQAGQGLAEKADELNGSAAPGQDDTAAQNEPASSADEDLGESEGPDDLEKPGEPGELEESAESDEAEEADEDADDAANEAESADDEGDQADEDREDA